MILLLMLLSAVSTNAKEKRPYAWLDEYSNTVTFSYDNNYSLRMAVFLDEEIEGIIGRFYYIAYKNNFGIRIEKVVFDASFADYRPESTADWLSETPSIGHDEPMLLQVDGLENLNTSEVTDMVRMFRDCAHLTSLDLSSWNTSLVGDIDISEMFYGCENLKTIYVGKKWSVDNASDSHNVFYECTSLVGGEGTVYAPEHTDADYAHVDGGPDNPGYFTLKSNLSTEVRGVPFSSIEEKEWFSIDGLRQSGQYRGLNIVRQKDGEVKKVLVK